LLSSHHLSSHIRLISHYLATSCNVFTGPKEKGEQTQTISFLVSITLKGQKEPLNKKRRKITLENSRNRSETQTKSHVSLSKEK
jgi:hypothetical protein